MSASAERLNERSINTKAAQAAATGKRLNLAGGERGLWLRITPGGVKSWSLMTVRPDGRHPQRLPHVQDGAGCDGAGGHARHHVRVLF